MDGPRKRGRMDWASAVAGDIFRGDPVMAQIDAALASQDAPSVDDQSTTGDFMTKYHWRNGIHFERLEDGSVKVTGNGPDFTIPQNEWPSIVAGVSRDVTQYNEAVKLHG